MRELMRKMTKHHGDGAMQAGEDQEASADGAASGEHTRIAKLYKQYSPQLSATLRKMYGDGPPDPDDIAQQAFARVMERGETNSIENLKAFVWRTARNLVFKAHRSNEVRSKYDFEIDQLFFPLKADELTPERVIVAREQLQAINDVLLKMPEKRRRAFLLHRIEGYSVSAVARRLGVSRSTADEHIARAAADINRRLIEAQEG